MTMEGVQCANPAVAVFKKQPSMAMGHRGRAGRQCV